MATLADVRANLMAAFGAVGATVYDYVPPVVSTPALFLFPDEPYLDVQNIGSGTVRVSVHFRIIAAVSSLDNKASLGQLEELLVATLAALPNGAIASQWDKPSIDTVGPSDLLVSTMTIELLTALEA